MTKYPAENTILAMALKERLTRLRDSLQLTEQDRQNRQRVIENLDPAENGMLILVRKSQQGVWIEGDIWVRILSIERDRVKLGISAPSDLKVMREELVDVKPPEGSEPKKP